MIFLWFGDRAGYCAHWAASGVGAVYARFLFLLPNGGSLAELRGCGLAFYCL